jgi:hypothetical protein
MTTSAWLLRWLLGASGWSGLKTGVVAFAHRCAKRLIILRKTKIGLNINLCFVKDFDMTKLLKKNTSFE